MGERGAAILSSPPPPPLAHSHMHWLTAQITHTTVSAPLQHRHSDNGTLWLSYFCYKKKKERTSIPSDATAAEQKTLHNSDGTMTEFSKQNRKLARKKGFKKNKKNKTKTDVSQQQVRAWAIR